MEVFVMKLFSIIVNMPNLATQWQKKLFRLARAWLGCCLLLAPLLGFTYSSTSYFCAKTNNYVNLGDTIDQVTKTCGDPTQAKTWNSVKGETVPVEQWLYQTLTPITTTGKEVFINSSFPIPLVVNFKEGQVIRILANGSEVQESYFCNPDTPIKVGYAKADVLKVCNDPAMVKNTSQQIKKEVATQLIYIYQPNWYDRPVSMYFENFKLVKIEQ